ncbi:MAG: futalosine hydrolase [Candidatus Eremiobacteraeota bacterium]|nr:futalosine hydrolase [Candidatus Eremiobacteraeota bacterium]
MILITCAVGEELRFMKPAPHVEMLVTGVGMVEASSSIARALAQSPYSLLINAGIAGAFRGTAEIGEGVVVADEFVELGLETGEAFTLPDGAGLVDRVNSDLSLVDSVVEHGFSSKRGITVSSVTATDLTAARLARFDVEVETMEGFAALRAAEMAGVPAIEVRGIANIVGDRRKSGWNFAAGVNGLSNVLQTLLKVLVRDGE